MTITVTDPGPLELLLRAERHAEILQRSSNRLDLLSCLLLNFDDEMEFGGDMRATVADYLMDIEQDIRDIAAALEKAGGQSQGAQEQAS